MKKQNTVQEKIKLDKLLKVLFKLSKKVTVNLVNGLFNENFKPSRVTIQYTNSEFIDDQFETIYGDLFLSVQSEEKLFNYHIEFQTLNDSSMGVRMFKYGIGKAVELANHSAEEEIIFHYPKQIVIFLEENENIKDKISYILRLPDHEDIRLTVPVMKYWNYTAEELKESKIYALLPLQVFKLRKSIKNIYNSNRLHEEKAQLINEEFKKLIEAIDITRGILGELYDNKEIIGSDLEKISRVLSNISEYLYKKYGEYKAVGEEVKVMVTTLVDPVVRKEARREGIKEGKKDAVLGMLREGLEVELIARIIGFPLTEIEEIKKQAGNH